MKQNQETRNRGWGLVLALGIVVIILATALILVSCVKPIDRNAVFLTNVEDTYGGNNEEDEEEVEETDEEEIDESELNQELEEELEEDEEEVEEPEEEEDVEKPVITYGNTRLMTLSCPTGVSGVLYLEKTYTDGVTTDMKLKVTLNSNEEMMVRLVFSYNNGVKTWESWHEIEIGKTTLYFPAEHVNNVVVKVLAV